MPRFFEFAYNTPQGGADDIVDTAETESDARKKL